MVDDGEIDALVPERVWQEIARGLMEAQPSRMFQVLRDCGALARLFPEIDRLFGVPQPPQHHPEIDTGVHVMLVVDWAARQGMSLPVRFAALTHDLGKGVTPPELWPKHHGHEAQRRRTGARTERAHPGAGRLPRSCRRGGARPWQRPPRAGIAPRERSSNCWNGSTPSAVPIASRHSCRPANAISVAGRATRTSLFPHPDYLRQALQAAQAIDAAGVARSAEPARIREAIFQARAPGGGGVAGARSRIVMNSGLLAHDVCVDRAPPISAGRWGDVKADRPHWNCEAAHASKFSFRNLARRHAIRQDRPRS